MQTFDVLNPPFDRLTAEEADGLRRHVDIGYYRPGAVIVARGKPAELLHVVIKGAVETRIDDAPLAVLRAGDTFDARAVVHGEAGEDFVAAEETLCFLIPREVIVRLVHANRAFAAFFYAEISRKLDELTAWKPREGVDAVLRTRIRDARHGPAVFLPADATLEEAARQMLAADVDAVFIEAGGRTGLLTGHKVTRAAVIEKRPFDTPVRDLAKFDLTAVEADQVLLDALLVMTRHGHRRIAVRENGRYTGWLRDIDLLGAFAGNAQLVPSRIDRAERPEELREPAQDIAVQAEQLHRQGVRVDAIAQVISDLNRRLYAKLFALLAPPAIREAGCLFLMGSEGRGEQTYRTDQDNGLILARRVPEDDLATFRAAFSEALGELGFPPCPGEIMVRNPLWSQEADGFVNQLRLWTLAGDPDAAMNLAIFADAAAVAGDPAPLQRAKNYLVEAVRGETRLLAQIANLINIVGEGGHGGLFDAVFARIGLRRGELDLKRAGLFPLVHGVRVLAIEAGLAPTGTAERIRALVERGVLEEGFGRDLASALRAFMALRLERQLAAAHRGQVGDPVTLATDAMPTLERDLLREALRIVRQFREVIHVRYSLGQF
ncbi:putative CBS domain and cyclic nucleotide-regulated nucleotidyltransferase [Methylobacterium sp. 4-46]|uniref:DUF294 nucleotidyltransferase-like domain-containing protein n=1 Tax=unclassified Methylobacterium TaxID=2615210 RepID=UPI000152CD6D|nr:MULTISPECIES: DUF294 nucleotidyltransferase-like domain-containing protein [Methylobacterium]ACA14634.1 putative CBS domain and cyclic nucleotide-regulated nucleotidyltransferase [Methylobacterium sp. 4-46]WFT80388.1 DUF294 nucleotidyltransferase-like domain-containing protein [Methylobacterium nodulans]